MSGEITWMDYESVEILKLIKNLFGKYKQCFGLSSWTSVLFFSRVLCDLTPAIVHLSLCAALCMWLKHRELPEVMRLPSQGFPFTYSTFMDINYTFTLL